MSLLRFRSQIPVLEIARSDVGATKQSNFEFASDPKDHEAISQAQTRTLLMRARGNIKQLEQGYN
jgi:hypothetical protein